jgi:hypothetical protein
LYAYWKVSAESLYRALALKPFVIYGGIVDAHLV